MSDIRVILKDGTVREFPDRGRPGGSWANHVKYEGAFVIVIDCYEKQTAFPAADIKEVIVERERGGW